MKMYSKEEIVEICKTMHHFAEYISSNIMQCFIRNEWTTEQEELLQQAPAEDDEYIAFINLGFQCARSVDALLQYLDAQIIRYRHSFPHNDIDEYCSNREAEQQNQTGNEGNGDENARRPLFVDTALSESVAEDKAQQNSLAVVINLLCIADGFQYAARTFARTIFEFYPKCRYLLAAAVHEEPVANHIVYFNRVYPKPLCPAEHALFLIDKHAMGATIAVRPADWNKDTEQIQKIINSSVPSREAFVSKSAEVHCFVVVVDYKVVGAVYAVDLSIDEAKEMNTAFQVSSVLGSKRLLSELTASRLVFFTLNPIFNVHAKGILKEVMRHLDVDTLLYRDDKSKSNPDPQTCVMENVIQIKPRHFVFGSDNSKRGTYALYAMNRRDFSKNR